MLLPVVWLEEQFEMDGGTAKNLMILDKLFFLSKLIPIIMLIFTLPSATGHFRSHFKRSGKVGISKEEENAPQNSVPQQLSVEPRETSAKAKQEIKTIS